MDCRIKSGNDAMESRSRDAFFAPELCQAISQARHCEERQRRSNPCDSEGLDCFASLAMTTANKIKEAERRQTCIQPPHAAACGARPCLFSLPRLRGEGRGGARSPVGVPPRRLLARTNAPAQLQLRASWDLDGRNDPDGSKDRARLSGPYPLPSCPSPAGCPADRSSCRPGVSTRSRPGAAVTSRRPREPHSLRQPASPAGVLYESEILERVTEKGTNVKNGH